VANNTNLSLSSGVSGVFGLGSNGLGGGLSDTVFGPWFALHPNAQNFTYGLNLNPPGSAIAGTLDWTSPDPSAYSGEVTWFNCLTSSTGPITSEFVITLDKWVFSSSGITLSNTLGGVAVIDPFYPNIFMPRNLSREICQSLSCVFCEISDRHSVLGIPGAVVQPGAISEGYLIPCDTKMTFTTHFESITVTMDQSTLIQSVDGNCFSTILGWADPTIDVYLLGSNFISASYLYVSQLPYSSPLTNSSRLHFPAFSSYPCNLPTSLASHYSRARRSYQTQP
jgi:hypothetical protein